MTPWALNDPFTCLSHPFTWAPGKQEACFIQLLFPDPAYHPIHSKSSINACEQPSRQWLLSPGLCHTAVNCPLRELPHPQVLLQLAWSSSTPSCARPSADTHSHGAARSEGWRWSISQIPWKLWDAALVCTVTSYTLLCSSKNKMGYQLKVMCPGTKAFWRGDSISPIHVLPVAEEHNASFITLILITQQNFLTSETALSSPELTQSPSRSLRHGLPGGFMPSKHWAAEGI